MSGTISPTTASPPTAVQAATQMLQTIAALGGIPTDYNPGSQIRVQAQSIGNIVEQQGISAQALALQAIVYGAMGLFGIYPSSGTPATGVVTFATSFPVSAAPTATQAIPIPAGTIVQTPGGALFSTLLAATLASGTASVNVGVAANAIGTAGNVPALAISGPPLTNVGWPLSVENAAPTGGGANAGTPSQALALFAATVAKLGRASPIAVANAPVGITVSGTGETVEYAWCYDDQTEILTENGWYLFRDLPYDMAVATLNPETHQLEYQIPTKYHAYAYSGRMITVEGRFLDLCVTPEHSVYVRTRGEKRWRFEKAEDLRQSHQINRRCEWTGREEEYFQLGDQKIPMDIWLEFFGYFIAEGCAGTYIFTQTKDYPGGQTKKGAKRKRYSVQIQQHDPAMRAMMVTCARKAGFVVTEQGTGFAITNKILTEYLQNFGKSYEKYLPDYVRNLSSRQSKILLDAMIVGDGYDGRDKPKNCHTEVVYTTTSPQLASDVQELALKTGIAATIATENRTGRDIYIKGRGKTGTVRRSCYNVRLHQKLHENTVWRNKSACQYSGIVYCVTVPNHIVYVRRNGKVCWCGQCYEPWLTAGTGAGSGTAGYTVFIDNGTGGASNDLITAVTSYLTGNTALDQDGYRPIGVPFAVSAASPVYALVGVTGVIYPGIVSSGTVQASVIANVEAYFAGLGSALLYPAEQPQIGAAAANAGQGLFQSLAVSLYYSGSGTPVPSVTGTYADRVILGGLSVSVTNG